MKNDRYHVCATCIHFHAERNNAGKMVYQCKRLGYETMPNYKFNCWVPKEHVVNLIQKGGDEHACSSIS